MKDSHKGTVTISHEPLVVLYAIEPWNLHRQGKDMACGLLRLRCRITQDCGMLLVAAAALSRQARYQEVTGNLRVKEVRIAEDERFVICRNPHGAERDAATRARLVAQLKEKTAAPTSSAPPGVPSCAAPSPPGPG